MDELAAAIGKGQANENQKAERRDLAPQQEQIRQATLQLSRRLERLQAKEAADAAKEAADKMKQAANAAESGSTATAGRQAMDAEHQLADAADKLKRKLAEIARSKLSIDRPAWRTPSGAFIARSRKSSETRGNTRHWNASAPWVVNKFSTCLSWRGSNRDSAKKQTACLRRWTQ